MPRGLLQSFFKQEVMKNKGYEHFLFKMAEMCTRRFLGMTKMPFPPIRKLPEVSSIGQVSWCSMALGGIWKAFQVIFWCEYVCWDAFSDTW